MEVRIPHAMDPLRAGERLQAVARRHDVKIEPEAGGLAGTVEKKAAFVGTVRARYRVEPEAIVITILDKPAFLPEGTLRRMLEDELGREL